jgi:endoglucanase
VFFSKLFPQNSFLKTLFNLKELLENSMLYACHKRHCFAVFMLASVFGWQTASAQHNHHPSMDSEFTDLATLGMSNGSNHTGHDGLVGGRTAITTEAVLAYNRLRHFVGLPPVTSDEVGAWAFVNDLTNNTQAWGNDQLGVGIWYAMQGAKVGWMADSTFDPQVVADISRTARLGDPGDVMAMVVQYGHEGFADYLIANGYEETFINTLKMEPHYAGWMHDRAHGLLSIEGVAIAHDVNHLTVLSHDQMQPFMNDTWDWPQWPALEVSEARVLEYFQSMVVLGDPLVNHLSDLGDPPTVGNDSEDPPTDDDPETPPVDDSTTYYIDDISVEVDGELWWGGFTAIIAVRNESDIMLDQWQFRFFSSHTISKDQWGCTVETIDLGDGLYEHRVSGYEWGKSISAGETMYVSFNGSQGLPLGDSGQLDAAGLFDGGWIADFETTVPPATDPPTGNSDRVSVDVDGDLWWGGFTAGLAVNNETDGKLDDWNFRFLSTHTIAGAPWGCQVETTDLGNGLYEHNVTGTEWAKSIPAGVTVFVGFNGQQGAALGNTGLLDADGLFDGGWIGD